MIRIVHANIFNTNTDALVNPVNCVGVAGAGLALQFRKRFPENFKAYVHACEKGLVAIGEPYFFYDSTLHKYIINFPTKNHWREDSNLDYIRKGFESLVRRIPCYPISSVAVPQLGCGLGALQWKDVRPIILQYADMCPDIVWVIVDKYDPCDNKLIHRGTKR